MIDYAAIIKRYRPRGYRIAQSRKRVEYNTGEVDFDKRVIYCPIIDTREALQTFLHECAHVQLGHAKGDMNMAKQEFEAEKHSIDTLRREGISVSKGMVEHGREYVRGCPDFNTAPAYVKRWANV